MRKKESRQVEIRRPAVRIRQGKRDLFLTSFCVSDFFAEDFCRVDRLDVQNARGMQRLLNTARARSFGKDILGAYEYDEAFLPTSVFLATGGVISYDESTKELFFESTPDAGICPFDIVDGQHRIEGLKMAAKENKRLRNFPISTIIAHEMTEAERMLQFVTVNTKQQPVNEGVAQHIIARFTGMDGLEQLPYLPQWLERQVKTGDNELALRIAKFLNDEDSSPWRGRIRFADNDTRDPRITINQAAFVRSVRRHLLAKNHPLSQVVTDEQRQRRILRNFWIAVERIFISTDADEKSVVFKTTGLEFFHSISAPVINQLAKRMDYTVEAIEECIESVGDYLPSSAAEMMSPEFWQSGNKASGMNRGATE